MRLHFNSSVSESAIQKHSCFVLSRLEVRRNRWRQIVKCRLHINVRFTVEALTDGGNHTRYPIKILCRMDIERAHDWAAENSHERDYLIFRTPMKIGLRNSEIRTFCAEGIDYEACHVRILDSKKHVYFTLPADIETLELYKHYLKGRTEGLMFTQKTAWKNIKANVPLREQTIWNIIHQIGLAVGIPNLRPGHLRDYFAATAEYKLKWPRKITQGMMRHDDPASLESYLNALHDSDEIDKVYHESMDGHYFNPPNVCLDCSSLKVCKYADRTPVFATGCAFKPEIKKEIT